MLHDWSTWKCFRTSMIFSLFIALFVLTLMKTGHPMSPDQWYPMGRIQIKLDLYCHNKEWMLAAKYQQLCFPPLYLILLPLFPCFFSCVKELAGPWIFKWSYSSVTLHTFSPLKSPPFLFCPHDIILTQLLWLNFFSKILCYHLLLPSSCPAVLGVLLQPFCANFHRTSYREWCHCWLLYLPFSGLLLTFAWKCLLFSCHLLLSLAPREPFWKEPIGLRGDQYALDRVNLEKRLCKSPGCRASPVGSKSWASSMWRVV